MPELIEAYSPLSEKAVRRDGTVGIKIIGPGWGSSGYYDRAVLERDVPRAFPPGTHMYWNHPTMSEAVERPERDLRDLAAVTVSTPRWEDSGSQGPGMYAEAAVFSGYKETVDQIAEHIGVSIMGEGATEIGKAEGRQGPIVKEIARGASIDFVTKPGAGGKVLKIFESAPGGERLPAPSIQQFLAEAGRVLSAANEKRLRTALEELNSVLSLLARDDKDMSEAWRKLEEAANVGEWLESRLHLALTTIADEMFGEGRLNREERIALSKAIGEALDSYHNSIQQNAPHLYERSPWMDAPGAAMMSESAAARPIIDPSEERERMNLQEAEAAIAERDRQLQEQRATIARLQEMSLIREAKDFVIGKLATANLPEVSKANLTRDLAANPPVKEGELDEVALTARIEEAVTARQAEIAAALGQTGQITGMGEGGNGTGDGVQAPAFAESQKRTGAALSRLGYQGGNNGN